MTNPIDSRRDFLRKLSYLAASGSAAAFVPQLRLMNSALASPFETDSLGGYRALVCVYLAGGNDSWNMLIPYESTRYGIYKDSRGGDATSSLAIPRQNLLQLTGATGSGSTDYALHPQASLLRDRYNAQQLAFVVNMGTLTKPITKAQYSDAANRPPQLYSHSDQENLWHVGTSADNKAGWGGRSMDVLRPQFPPTNNASLPACISIAGNNKFQIGANKLPYQMSTSGVSGMSGVCNPSPCTGFSGQRDNALNHLLSDVSFSANAVGGEYRNVVSSGRGLFSLINDGLSTLNGNMDGTINTVFPTNNSLGDQLKMVARMIKLSRARGLAARQIYYVRYGGFDLHDGLLNGHQTLLTNLSNAMDKFWAAMGEIGAQSDVTAFTMSEFARTLSSNGDGSDHAWGGVQMVMGGAVKGGKLYTDGGVVGNNAFPDQTLNGPVSFTRGQFIPGISVDQYTATMAKWLGLADNQLDAIFPNLAAFNQSYRDLGFLTA